MMYEILLIALFPIIGYIMGRPDKRNTLLFMIFIPLFLLLPVTFSPYHYSVTWLADVFLTVMLAGLYGLLMTRSKTSWKKKGLSILLFILLFITLFFNQLILDIAGRVDLEKQWKKEQYSISKQEAEGFSGGAVYYYQLKKHRFMGILEADLERHIVRPAEDTICEIRLYDKLEFRYITFDKCQEKFK